MSASEDKIKAVLEGELGYTKQQFDAVVEDLKDLSPELKSLFERWIENREDKGDFEAHGFSVSGLMEKFKMNFVAAILTMDWIVKEPDGAVKAIKASFLVK